MSDILKRVPTRVVEAATKAVEDNTDLSFREAQALARAVLRATFEVLWGGK